MSQQWATQRRKFLSDIPEEAGIEILLYLVIIGQGATTVIQGICEEAQIRWGFDRETTIRQEKTASSKSSRRGIGKSESGHFDLTAPYGCKVAFEKEIKANATSSTGSPKEYYRLTSNSRLTSSSLAIPSKDSLEIEDEVQVASTCSHSLTSEDSKPSRSEGIESEVCSSSSTPQAETKVKIVVKLNLYPVETFADVIPLCSTLEILSSVHFVFMLDERSSKTNNDSINDLTRRFHEVELSVKSGMKAHTGKMNDKPCVLMSLLQHTQPDNHEVIDLDEEIHRRMRASQSSEGSDTGSEFDENKYQASLSLLTQQIRDYVKYQEFPIQYLCDFEDRKSVFKTTMKMVQLYFAKDLRRHAEHAEQPNVNVHRSCLPCCVQ